MSDGLTPNLKLRVSTSLTPASRYNLERIDDAFSRLTISLTGSTLLRSATDITIEPQSADSGIGGSGVGGTVNVGTPSHLLTAINLYGPVTVASSLSMKDQAAGGTAYLGLRYQSDLNGATDLVNRTLSFDLQGANRSLILGGNIQTAGSLTTAGAFALTLTTTAATNVTLPTTGTLATLAGAETLTNKSMDGDNNTFTDIGLTSLKTVLADAGKVLVRDGAGAVVSALLIDANVATGAAIAYAKLATLAIDRALVSDGTGHVAVSAVTATELGYLSGATGPIQPQFGAKANTALNNLTIAGLTAGDILYATSATALTRLPLGTPGQVLTAGATPVWAPSAGGSGSGILRVTYIDLTATTLPTGTAYSPDGVPVVNGDLVLFTALLAGNSEVYVVSGVGTALAWSPLPYFAGGTSLTPTAGEQILANGGTSLGGGVAIGQFDGTLWRFNRTVRHFEGADYWEESALFTTTLLDNNTGNVFTVAATGSENWVIHFSVVRGALRTVGTLHLVTDGVTAQVAESGVELSTAVGVSFAADISAGNLRLRYTTTSTGTAAVMKWHHERWSSSAGGPASVPNYSVSAGSVPAAGLPGSVQLRGSTGFLDSDVDLTYDTTEDALVQNGTYRQKRATATLLDNQAVAVDAFTLPVAWTYALIEYGLTRGADREVGTIMVTHDGTTAFLSADSLVSSPSMGVTFSPALSAGLVRIRYTTTATGTAASMSYNVTKFT